MLLAVALVAVTGVVALRTVTSTLGSTTCSATSGNATVSLSAEQAGNAAVISGLAVRRGLPERAAVIAVATAMQESKLRNLTVGDRDSLGLFQQRPSQGWGTPEQLLDPVIASGKFYDALVKVDDYLDRPLTEVAQDVQRSAHPTAYAQHEDEATTLAAVLTGSEQAAMVCDLGAPDEAGDAAALAQDLERQTGVALQISSADSLAGELGTQRRAWTVGAWAVAHADARHVDSVQVGRYRWTRSEDPQWQEVADSDADAAGVRITVAPAPTD